MSVQQIGALCGSLLLLSCQRYIEIPLPYEGAKLVVFCVLNPDEAVTARLSRTYPPTGPRPTDWYVADAEVILYEDDRGADTLAYDEDRQTYYSASAFRPRAGHRYWLTAKASGYGEIRSDTVEVPQLVHWTSIQFRDSILETGSTNVAGGDIELIFSDPRPGQNFYAVRASTFLDGEEDTYNICLGGDVLSECLGTESFSCTFSDECLTASPSGFRIGLQTSRQTRPPTRVEYIVLHFQSLDYDLYLYDKNNTQPRGFEFAFSDPVSIYTNIQGGYGLLGAFSEQRDTLYLP